MDTVTRSRVVEVLSCHKIYRSQTDVLEVITRIEVEVEVDFKFSLNFIRSLLPEVEVY